MIICVFNSSCKKYTISYGAITDFWRKMRFLVYPKRYKCLGYRRAAIKGIANSKPSNFSSFYLFSWPKELQFFKAFKEQHTQFTRVTAPALQHDAGMPQPLCPLFALLCLCNFLPMVTSMFVTLISRCQATAYRPTFREHCS